MTEIAFIPEAFIDLNYAECTNSIQLERSPKLRETVGFL